MGQQLKTPKGEINITNYEGRIRLRWRYAGDRYSLNLPYAYLPENLHYGTIKATEVKLDILKGCFDPSLKKYKASSVSKPVASKPVEIEGANNAGKLPIYLDSLVPKFNDWCKNIRNVDVDASIDYLYTRRLLEKWVNIPIDQLAQKLNGEKWAAVTYNRRLTYLTSFFCWLLRLGIVQQNPLQDVCRRRDKGKKKNLRRKPLDEQEIITFLSAIRNDEYCHPFASVKHSYYYPFLSFMFYTGVRNAEAIGLRVKHVDLVNRQVEISETFARTIKGTNHAARVQKGTKTENVRFLPLTDDLINLLEKQVSGKGQDAFVFPSPKGLSIDCRFLRMLTHHSCSC
jgi:integrase